MRGECETYVGNVTGAGTEGGSQSGSVGGITEFGVCGVCPLVRESLDFVLN